MAAAPKHSLAYKTFLLPDRPVSCGHLSALATRTERFGEMKYQGSCTSRKGNWKKTNREIVAI